MAGRLSWGLGDQAASSLTNFAVGVYVARSLGATAFGIFSLVWVTYSVVLNLSRGLTTDPLVVRFTGEETASWREAVSQSSGTALLIGTLTGAVSLLAGLTLGGPLGAGFVALGLVLPALLLQDSWRFAFFAVGQGGKAFANDLVWAATLVPAMIVADTSGSVFQFVLAWGLSGALAAAYGCLQSRLLPRPGGAHRWLRHQRDLGPRYLVENVSISGSSLLRMYGLGAIAGLADVGAVRGADLLLGPFIAVMMGLSLVAVPEAARVLQRSPRRLPLFCLLLGGGQAGAALVWGFGLLFVLPNNVGQFLLGSVWPSASALIVPAILAVTIGSFFTAAIAGLRALGTARRSLRAQLLASAAYVACGVAGAAVAGALGSSWGVALAALISAAVSWSQLHIAVREQPAQHSPTPPVAPGQQLGHGETSLP
ncbi:MAG: hypothetical protein ACRDRA_16935 [Pseudonocardiaceae bacterium]